MVPPCTNSELLGNEPLLIRFSKAEVSRGGGTVPGGNGAPGGGVGQPASTQGVGRNILFRIHWPVVWLLLVGKPGMTGGRCCEGTKKNVRLYLSLKSP